MRKVVALITMLVLSAAVASCGSSDGSADNTTTTSGDGTTTTAPSSTTTVPPLDCDGTPASVTDVGQASDFTPVVADTLTVVTSLPGPGFFEGSDDDPTKITSGFEYDLAKAMQAEFGLANLVVRNENFDTITGGTVTKYDIALSQISITCDRAKVVKFSLPYFYSNQGVLVNSSFSQPITTVDEAKKIRWGVQTSTTAIDLLDKLKPDTDPKVFQQLPDAYAALQAGQVDAVLIDTAINLGEAARSNGTFKVVAQFSQAGGPDQYGAILPKDSPNAPAINAVLTSLQESGKLAELATKDLTADPGTIPTVDLP